MVAQYQICSLHQMLVKKDAMKNLKESGITWKLKELDLGNVIVGTPYTVTFEYDGSIKAVRTTCGCTIAEPPKNGILNVDFTPKPKPGHITGPWSVVKRVYVDSETGTDELIIKAIIE